jgi:hypothetical protein
MIIAAATQPDAKNERVEITNASFLAMNIVSWHMNWRRLRATLARADVSNGLPADKLSA